MSEIRMPLADLLIIRQVFLPANPNKMRKAHPDVVRVAKEFIAQVEAASKKSPSPGEGE